MLLYKELAKDTCFNKSSTPIAWYFTTLKLQCITQFSLSVNQIYSFLFLLNYLKQNIILLICIVLNSLKLLIEEDEFLTLVLTVSRGQF